MSKWLQRNFQQISVSFTYQSNDLKGPVPYLNELTDHINSKIVMCFVSISSGYSGVISK